MVRRKLLTASRCPSRRLITLLGVVPLAALALAAGAGLAFAEPPDEPGKPAQAAAAEQGQGQGQGQKPSREHRPDRAGAPATEDTSQPQPPSNADFTDHGANTHGPYDSTRDGSPSENGNGSGAAVGKPCAGCVGKADNKNPSGQLPGGSDPNAGYECDRNSGVGKGNPAHTSCAEPAPEADEPTVPEKPKAPQRPGARQADVPSPTPADRDEPEQESPAAGGDAAQEGLAVTGSPAGALTALGLGTLGAGVLLCWASAMRSRRET